MRSFRLVAVRGCSQCGRCDWWPFADVPNAVVPIGGRSRMFPMRSLRLVAVREYSQCGRSDWWGGHARQRTSSRWQMALKERSSTRRSGAPRSGPSCVIALSCQGARGASGDWCSSGEYTASARAIGARPGNIPPPIARRQQEACPRQGSRSR
eukprot:1460826-Pyramimonas_sp.AAC.1